LCFSSASTYFDEGEIDSGTMIAAPVGGVIGRLPAHAHGERDRVTCRTFYFPFAMLF
jgi:hypothetical protein